jgi:hypothetical protein
MRIVPGSLFAAGFVLSSFLTGCVAAESPLKEEEEMAEARGAFAIGTPTMIECYDNYQNDTADCYEIDDLEDHRLCLELTELVFNRCRREASDAPIPEDDDELVTGGTGGGFVPGFLEDQDPWVIIDP